MTEDLKIERLTTERLKDVQFLAKACINTTFTLDFLLAKYQTKEYAGVEFCCCVGYINDQPVGFYGSVPVLLSTNNQNGTKLIFQSCDTYTLPAHQGKGIHKKLALASYELMKAAGSEAVFAFLNENSFNSCKKLDWKLIRRFQVIEIRPKTLFPTLKLLDKVTLLRSYSVKRIHQKLKHYEQSKTIKNDFVKENLSTIFSDEYIRYKNGKRVFILKLGESKVWLKIDVVIYIGAIENFHSENALQIILEIEKIALKLGTNKIIFEIEKSHPAFEILSKTYTARDAFKLGGLAFNENFNFEEVRFNFSVFDNFLSS